MASTGTLWGTRHQLTVRIILSITAINGQVLEQPEFDFKNKPAEFLSKFPFGKVPTFEAPDGFKLNEGMTIARYLCARGSVNLLGSGAKEIAQIDQWVHFFEGEIGAPVRNISGLVYGFAGAFGREHLDKHAESLHRALRHVEAHLATCSSGYLVSDTLTLADLALAGMVFAASYASLGDAERAKYPNVLAHYAKVGEDERLKQFWGTETFTDVRATGPRPLFA